MCSTKQPPGSYRWFSSSLGPVAAHQSVLIPKQRPPRKMSPANEAYFFALFFCRVRGGSSFARIERANIVVVYIHELAHAPVPLARLRHSSPVHIPASSPFCFSSPASVPNGPTDRGHDLAPDWPHRHRSPIHLTFITTLNFYPPNIQPSPSTYYSQRTRIELEESNLIVLLGWLAVVAAESPPFGR